VSASDRVTSSLGCAVAFVAMVVSAAPPVQAQQCELVPVGSIPSRSPAVWGAEKPDGQVLLLDRDEHVWLMSSRGVEGLGLLGGDRERFGAFSIGISANRFWLWSPRRNQVVRADMSPAGVGTFGSQSADVWVLGVDQSWKVLGARADTLVLELAGEDRKPERRVVLRSSDGSTREIARLGGQARPIEIRMDTRTVVVARPWQLVDVAAVSPDGSLIAIARQSDGTTVPQDRAILSLMDLSGRQLGSWRISGPVEEVDSTSSARWLENVLSAPLISALGGDSEARSALRREIPSATVRPPVGQLVVGLDGSVWVIPNIEGLPTTSGWTILRMNVQLDGSQYHVEDRCVLRAGLQAVASRRSRLLVTDANGDLYEVSPTARR
jgi:hypothetical protein